MSRKTVTIFCGHGISKDGTMDSGCVYGKYTEAALMEKITRSAVYYLKQCNLNVITDVPGNKINMYAQVDKANASGADLFVSVHCDYYKAESGTLPLYTSEEGREAAKWMNKYVMFYSSIPTRGLGKRTNLYELNATNMPAVIFECGSIRWDRKRFSREYDFIGFGIARGICKYLGVAFTPVQFKLTQKLKELEPEVVKNLHYNGKATNTTFKKALNGNKGVNCALYYTWGLQRSNVLNYKQRIWLGNAVNGPSAGSFKKKCNVSHPNKLTKNCDIHVADGVGYQWGKSSDNKVHTMVPYRYDKDQIVWFTCGSSDMKAKDLTRKRPKYWNMKLKTICRLKAK